MLNNFFNKLEDTIKGEDNKWSHRRITVLYYMGLLTFMIIMTAFGSIFSDIIWITVSGGAGIFSGLSIWQQRINKIKDENIDKNTPTRSFRNQSD